MTKLLLHCGADANAFTDERETLLHLLADLPASFLANDSLVLETETVGLLCERLLEFGAHTIVTKGDRQLKRWL